MKPEFFRKHARLLVICFILLSLAGIAILIYNPADGSDGTEHFLNLNQVTPESFSWFYVTDSQSTQNDIDYLENGGRLRDLLEVPLEITVCTLDKFLNLTASGVQPDVVTIGRMDASIKNFQRSNLVLTLPELLDQALPGFELTDEFTAWCSNLTKNVYELPHMPLSSGRRAGSSPGLVMLANRKMMEEYRFDAAVFETKEGVADALKQIRRRRTDISISYFDLAALQQMFGARIEDASGGWQDPFYQPETLEALRYMNLLYRERFLPYQSFSLSTEQLLEQLEREDIFLVAAGGLDEALLRLPEGSSIMSNYTVVGPIRPKSGKTLQFLNNYGGAYTATMFLSGSPYPEQQAKFLLYLYLQYHDLTDEQAGALQRKGWDNLFSSKLLPAYPQETLAALSPYQAFAAPGIPYELQFGYYDNTLIAASEGSMETYKREQLLRIVLETDTGNVEQVYSETVKALQEDNYALVSLWRRSKYGEALDLAGVSSIYID